MESKRNAAEDAKGLLDFIERSPASFQAAEEIGRRLLAAGVHQLREDQRWQLLPGQSYFCLRNGSALMAFRIPEKGGKGAGIPAFHIFACHDDSPSFKIKEDPEMTAGGGLIRLNTEPYGGMLMAPWFDRPLSVAGRIFFEEDGCLREKNICVDEDLLLIPSLAIHMNREANKGIAYKAQTDLLPLYAQGDKKGAFLSRIAREADIEPEQIVSHDLFLYNRMRGSLWGPEGEFISAPRLDDLECVYAGLEGFLGSIGEAGEKEIIPLLAVFDNEEVGSASMQGAAGGFLKDVLRRITLALAGDEEDLSIALSRSRMISADNAHAVHPAAAEKADPVNRPALNGGIVLKFSASLKYCTDASAAAWFRLLCRRTGQPCQVFVNHSEQAGGSTLGCKSVTQVGVSTADVGLAQLAMHSPCETAGSRDLSALISAAQFFFSGA